eukprot:1831331-Amphidinium_carterae.1
MDQFVLRKPKTSSNTDEVWQTQRAEAREIAERLGVDLHRSAKKRVGRPNHQIRWEDLIKAALTSHRFDVVGQLKQKEVPTWWRPTMGFVLEPPEHTLGRHWQLRPQVSLKSWSLMTLWRLLIRTVMMP